MQLTAEVPIRVLGILVLVVEGAIPRVMTFLATKVASICPQSTYSQGNFFAAPGQQHFPSSYSFRTA
ncbi:hypothetical protein TIFTF001_032077 [Ficus carica]|uniref:Uncharacterized protein n=1 Tax=Ficus carica TaxID=3494 RepID=A0AA88DWG8_FICCA|nr:hypothetical protein TIFTF001_032077 [Ficus carica]